MRSVTKAVAKKSASKAFASKKSRSQTTARKTSAPKPAPTSTSKTAAPKKSASKVAAPKTTAREPVLPAGDAGVYARLLADVLANPRDDGPRAVLADWLGEREDPRGELIALQLALAKPAIGARAYIYRDVEHTAREDELEAAVKRLLVKHQTAWLAPFRKYVRTWQWRRGFPDWFEADAAKFLEGVVAIAKHTPIAGVKLTAMKPPLLAKLCARAELIHLDSLDLHEQRIGPKEAPALGAAPFAALRELDLWGNPLGDDGLAAIVTSPHLANLKTLSLYKCGLTKASLVTLSRAPCLPSLENLDLTRLEGCDADVGALFAHATNLRELRLGDAVLTDEILESIAGNPAFAKLETLTVPNASTRLGSTDRHSERGVRAVLDSPHLRSLKRFAGVFKFDSDGPLGEGGPLAAEARARFGEDAC